MLEEGIGSGEDLDVESGVELMERPIAVELLEGFVEMGNSVCYGIGLCQVLDGWENGTQERAYGLLGIGLLW